MNFLGSIIESDRVASQHFNGRRTIGLRQETLLVLLVEINHDTQNIHECCSETFLDFDSMAYIAPIRLTLQHLMLVPRDRILVDLEKVT